MTASPSREITSLRFHLREKTAAIHADLDAAVGAFDSLESYGRYLRGQLAFREPTEQALSRVAIPAWFEGWRSRPIADAIRADLADLGVPAGLATEAGGELSTHLASPSGLLGALYVLEGSSLGARLLYRRALTLGLSETHGARHLALQTEDKGSWRRFLELLEHPDAINVEAAVIASTKTFELAHSAFTKGLDG